MDCSPPRLLCPWDSPGKNTGVGHHFLLQGIFPIQGSNSHFLHCRRILMESTGGFQLLANTYFLFWVVVFFNESSYWVWSVWVLLNSNILKYNFVFQIHRYPSFRQLEKIEEYSKISRICYLNFKGGLKFKVQKVKLITLLAVWSHSLPLLGLISSFYSISPREEARVWQMSFKRLWMFVEHLLRSTCWYKVPALWYHLLSLEERKKRKRSRSVMSNSLRPHGL